MAKNKFANLSEPNFCTPMVVGQANASGLARTAIHPQDGGIYTMACALEGAQLVGIKSDGLVYLASAEAGSGQVRALGVNFQEAVKGQAVDVISEPRTLFLDAMPTGGAIGGTAYLSPTTPGKITGTKPSTTGQLIQVVGVIVDPGGMAPAAVKVDVDVNTSLVP